MKLIDYLDTEPSQSGTAHANCNRCLRTRKSFDGYLFILCPITQVSVGWVDQGPGLNVEPSWADI